MRFNGQVHAFLNIDVKCKDECNEWEIHQKVPLNYSGAVEIGPNLIAIAAGSRLGPYAGVSVNTIALGGSLLEAEYKLLNDARTRFDIKLNTVLAEGPQKFCKAGGK